MGETLVKVSVDRLTILGADSGSFGETINNNNFGFIEGSSIAPHPYKRQFYMTDGSLLQYTDNKEMNALRYDFNPNNVNNHDSERTHQRAVADIIRTMKYPKISRVDIAIDLKDVDLGCYTFTDNVGRKSNSWVDSSNRLETLYVGAPNANLRLRIYNKAKEQKQEGVWWRIEAQIRNEWCEAVLKGANPFEGISIGKPSWKQIENVQERAMVKLLLDYPDTMSELSRHTKTKYKKMLTSLPTDEHLDAVPIYENNRKEVMKTINFWTMFAGRNNVI